MGTLHHPQWNHAARFTIGRDHHGWWVVNDRLGRIGGLFTNEDAAMHFAYAEAGHDTAKICHAPTGEEIELFDAPAPAPRPSLGERLLTHNRAMRHA